MTEVDTFRSELNISDLKSQSTKYIIADVKYTFCNKGHLTKKNENKCYFCSKIKSCPNIGEEKVRSYFENAFNEKFPREFPSWTAYLGIDNHPLNYLLISGYNDNYKLGFIYGDNNPLINNTLINMCLEKNIEIIVIPHMKSFSKLKSITRHKIKDYLNKHNITKTLSNSDEPKCPKDIGIEF